MEEKILVPMTDSEYQEWKKEKEPMTQEELINLIIKAFPFEINHTSGGPELYINKTFAREDDEVAVRIVIRSKKQFNY